MDEVIWDAVYFFIEVLINSALAWMIFYGFKEAFKQFQGLPSPGVSRRRGMTRLMHLLLTLYIYLLVFVNAPFLLAAIAFDFPIWVELLVVGICLVLLCAMVRTFKKRETLDVDWFLGLLGLSAPVLMIIAKFTLRYLPG